MSRPGEDAAASTPSTNAIRDGDFYADLRGEFKQCQPAYRAEDGSLIPTLTWEGLRAGATDWRYIATLEAAIAKAEGSRRRRGEAALRWVLAEVPWRDDTQRPWSNRQAAQLRRQIAEAILAQGALPERPSASHRLGP